MENENQNEIVESQNTEIAPEQRYYNGPVTLEEAESYITSGLVSTARNYVAIGYWLRRIRDGKLYEEEGHQNFEQYVHEKYGKDKGWASKCIKVNQQLSKDGDSPLLDSRYRDYSTYQLVELAYMTEEQREQATPEQTIKQLQEIRKPKEIPYYDIDGQQEMEKDYPEVIPVVMSQLFPGEEIPGTGRAGTAGWWNRQRFPSILRQSRSQFQVSQGNVLREKVNMAFACAAGKMGYSVVQRVSRVVMAGVGGWRSRQRKRLLR